ncbi:heparanase-like protein 1 [Rosa rugosa]|uniref:heparanase-like protein 1 n=1 Tax=Rosa rugosa TaxID=74645 RepID=UPI002B41734D|nr:heparanase-like protein 1 [Rosa rugosa]
MIMKRYEHLSCHLFCFCFTYILVYLGVGNELCGNGVGARVGAEQYGKDMMKLKQLVNQLYNDSHIKPAIVGPGGFYDQKWFATLLQVSGSGVVNVVTQHLYNLGPDSWKQWVRRRRKRLNERKSQRKLCSC